MHLSKLQTGPLMHVVMWKANLLTISLAQLYGVQAQVLDHPRAGTQRTGDVVRQGWYLHLCSGAWMMLSLGGEMLRLAECRPRDLQENSLGPLRTEEGKRKRKREGEGGDPIHIRNLNEGRKICFAK